MTSKGLGEMFEGNFVDTCIYGETVHCAQIRSENPHGHERKLYKPKASLSLFHSLNYYNEYDIF